jgi:hypothetical protein
MGMAGRSTFGQAYFQSIGNAGHKSQLDYLRLCMKGCEYKKFGFSTFCIMYSAIHGVVICLCLVVG